MTCSDDRQLDDYNAVKTEGVSECGPFCMLLLSLFLGNNDNVELSPVSYYNTEIRASADNSCCGSSYFSVR